MNNHINPLRVIAHLMSTNLALLELVEELTSSIDGKIKPHYSVTRLRVTAGSLCFTE